MWSLSKIYANLFYPTESPLPSKLIEHQLSVSRLRIEPDRTVETIIQISLLFGNRLHLNYFSSCEKLIVISIFKIGKLCKYPVNYLAVCYSSFRECLPWLLGGYTASSKYAFQTEHLIIIKLMCIVKFSSTKYTYYSQYQSLARRSALTPKSATAYVVFWGLIFIYLWR